MSRTIDDLYEFMAGIEDRLSKLNERVVVLVDRSNFEQTWHRIDPSSRPDYKFLLDTLVAGRLLQQARIYFSDIDPESVLEADKADWQRRQKFYNFLGHNGWILRGVTKKIYDGGIRVEKGLDAAIILDIDKIGKESNCDTIILVAGDADYCEPINNIIMNNCMKVEVAFFPQQTSRALQSVATKFINLEQQMGAIARRAC